MSTKISPFISAFNKNLNSVTENGCLTYSDSDNANLNFFALASAKRDSLNSAKELFEEALEENKSLARKNLFYLRDVRGGQGERDIFRVCMLYDIIKNGYTDDRNDIIYNIGQIPKYGRWDDFFWIMEAIYPSNESIYDFMVNFVKTILDLDEGKINLGHYENLTLCAKWFPLKNSVSSQWRKNLAKKLVDDIFDGNEKKCRKTIVNIRKHLNIVEQEMCSKKWSDIDYSKLPSYALMKHTKAFTRNDPFGFSEYTEAVKRGKKKVNSSVLYPYDIVYGVQRDGEEYEDIYDEMWRALPDYTGRNKNAICVVDTSGSMLSRVSKSSSVTALDVAISLGLYFAERSKGPFKDHFFTFSTEPELVKIYGNTMREKLSNMVSANWGYGTNIEAVFSLILSTAMRYKLKQEDLPETLYIISDMEFNESTDYSKTAFEYMKESFRAHGYSLPTIVFWNVNSRGRNLPVQKDEVGATIVSGLSPSAFKMAVQNKKPIEVMLDILGSERYARIR